MIECCNKYENRLTAGVVSNDVLFLDKVLGQTNNGVTYTGIRARTTGAPQNHWFGPCGDPRGAGIGTKEAILHCYTSHREIIRDYGPIVDNFKIPPPSWCILILSVQLYLRYWFKFFNYLFLIFIKNHQS